MSTSPHTTEQPPSMPQQRVPIIPKRRSPRSERLLAALQSGAWALVSAWALVGCSKPPYDVAPVAGILSLDGTPLAGARINTQPIGDESNEPGPGSFAVTDQNGHFVLELVHPPKPGAVVATHRVRITKVELDYDRGQADMPVRLATPLPPSASDGSLQLTVPAKGDLQVKINLETRS